MNVPCPVCEDEAGIVLTLTYDEQGEPPWTARMTYLEIAEGGCGCELSAEQAEAIIAEWNDQPFDYGDEAFVEPDY